MLRVSREPVPGGARAGMDAIIQHHRTTQDGRPGWRDGGAGTPAGPRDTQPARCVPPWVGPRRRGAASSIGGECRSSGSAGRRARQSEGGHKQQGNQTARTAVRESHRGILARRGRSQPPTPCNLFVRRIRAGQSEP